MNKEIIQQYADAGYKLVAVDSKKVSIGKWKERVYDVDEICANRCAIACGKASGNIEIIDFDLKYDTTGTLMSRYKQLVNSHCKDLIKKLVIQTTTNKGYHFIYKCDEVEGNLKLASRPTTQEEKDEYKKKLIDSGKSDLEAQQGAKNNKVKVLIETRGEGGYFACFPTEGYSMVKGDIANLNTITTEERKILIDCARSFNEYFTEVVEYKPKQKERRDDFIVSPFDDYNERGDVVGLLQKNGWTVVGEKGEKVMMKRPGQTDSVHSGDYHRGKNLFSVFSSSTEFEPQKGYRPVAVYAMLECNNNYSEVAKRLLAEGYGTPKQQLQPKTPKAEVQIENEENPLHFLANISDLKKYNKSVREGTLEMGKTTGIPKLDEYFVFKRKQFNVVNGIDNVGKSLVLWYLAVLSAAKHGWKWLILSHENEDGQIYKKLCEFYMTIPLTRMTNEQLLEAEEWVEKHFKIIKNVEIYNFTEALNMGSIVNDYLGIDGYLIDPYNSLRVDDTSNTHEWHYRATSEMRKFTKTQDVTIFLNCHAVTGATRMKDPDGNPLAPNKADTEGGTKFASKADDFLTIHRLTQDKEKFRDTQIHVRKVKDTDTGGRPSPFDFPVIIRLEESCRFLTDDIDPMRVWWSQQGRSFSVMHNNEEAPF